MRDEVLHGLLTARSLFTVARQHCFVRDHIASAGLIIVQDAFELVLYCCLLETGVDEERAIENVSFDQLIGELRKRNLPIIMSGILKAMNKQRVLIKHHAQLAEPAAVQNYYETAIHAADHLLIHIIGRPLQHIVIADAITNIDLATHIRDATAAIEERRYLDAMIASRKALFLAVESQYDIRPWADHDPRNPIPSPILRLGKAPYYTRNREWIRDNVNEPTDYIQLDHQRVTGEMLEIGIDPGEFFNVWRLTPSVYLNPDHGWAIKLEPGEKAAANEDNARYCVDVVASILTNQAIRQDVTRSRPYEHWQARVNREVAVRQRATADAPFEDVTLVSGNLYLIHCIVSGLDGSGDYIELSGLAENPPRRWFGFVPREACTIEEEP